jgi:hypothetical protein
MDKKWLNWKKVQCNLCKISLRETRTLDRKQKMWFKVDKTAQIFSPMLESDAL